MENLKVKGYGASGSILNSLKPMAFERTPPKEDEVLIDILYCGVCHSDLHQVKNDWGNTLYPCVPGHEVIGKILETGSAVTKFKAGDVVGVGCMIDSCGHCNPCKDGEENYCEGPVSWTATYNGPMKPDGSGYNTFGGYSDKIVVREAFLLSIPEALDIKSAAPILCAGITTYSPLKHWGIKEGSKVGVVGVGGLGHMAIKLAKAMGAEVTAITRDEDKRADAERFGASQVLISTDKEAIAKQELTLDFILVTIPDEFEVNLYIDLLKRDGVLVTVGLLAPYSKALNNMGMAMHRRSIAGSLIGGIAETQEVLNFCAEHGISPDTEMIKIQDINDAYDKMLDKEVHYRYVIDMQSLKEEEIS